MREDNLSRVLEECNAIIEMDFAPCGVADLVKSRIKELVGEWEKRKALADKEERNIGGLRLIFRNLLKLVGEAQRENDKCGYLQGALSRPFTEEGGLGYWAQTFWH